MISGKFQDNWNECYGPIECCEIHDDVIKWKQFPRYWPFVRGIHRSPVNSLHKGQWRGALKFSLICVWINGWVNNGEAGDLWRHLAHYDVTVMGYCCDKWEIWRRLKRMLWTNGISWDLSWECRSTAFIHSFSIKFPFNWNLFMTHNDMVVCSNCITLDIT